VKLEGVDAKTLMLKLSRPSLEGLVASACQGGAAGLERLYRNGRNLFEDSLKTEYGLDLKKRTEDFINKSTLYHKVTEAVERK
jgi:hypothetical protein